MTEGIPASDSHAARSRLRDPNYTAKPGEFLHVHFKFSLKSLKRPDATKEFTVYKGEHAQRSNIYVQVPSPLA